MTRAARLAPPTGYTPAESKAMGHRLPWTGTLDDLQGAIDALRRDELPDTGERAIRNAARFDRLLRLESEMVRLRAEERARRGWR